VTSPFGVPRVEGARVEDTRREVRGGPVAQLDTSSSVIVPIAWHRDPAARRRAEVDDERLSSCRQPCRDDADRDGAGAAIGRIVSDAPACCSHVVDPRDCGPVCRRERNLIARGTGLTPSR